jgi:lysophospholipase L1-like esterase
MKQRPPSSGVTGGASGVARTIAVGMVAAVALSACGATHSQTGGTGGSGDDAAIGNTGGASGDDAGGVTPDPHFPTGFWSTSVLGIPGNELVAPAGPILNTYRTFVRPRASGPAQWVFWMSNATDSTFGPGVPHPNETGAAWRIEAAYAGDGGTAHTGVVTGTSVPLTFGGSATKEVQPGERFWSDPITLDLPADHDLVFTWALSTAVGGPSIPGTSAPFLTSYIATGKNLASQDANTGFGASTDLLVAPQMFAIDRPITSRLCFLGDSITQGIGSTRDSYGYWVAKIADGLGPDVGVWNLGNGWARAADAASDGYWLAKAKQCTEVAVILGVNDIINSSRTADQILADLTTILGALKAHDPTTKTILFTVPTFNLGGGNYTTWKQVNDTIRAAPLPGADRVFDIAAVESRPAPDDGLLKVGYTNGDGHPNDTAGTAIADAFLAWYSTPPP